MNSSLRKQMNLRFKLLQAAQKTKKGSHEWKLYRKARNHCTKLLRLAEASYWKNKFQGLSSSSKEFWKCINEFTGKRKNNNKIGPLEDVNGNITNDDVEKCKSLNTYFATIGKLQKEPHNATLLSHIYQITPSAGKIDYDISMLPFVFDKVFKPGKAGGHDNVSSRMVRTIGNDIIEGLHYIAKGSFQTIKFPSRYKISKVSCIHKKGSKTNCGNYRPISLLCLPGKMLEAVFALNIDNHIYQHQLLSSHQWGFRKGRSPELMLLKLSEKWLAKVNKGLYVTFHRKRST